MMKLLFLVLLTFITSCQMTPTKTSSKTKIPGQEGPMEFQELLQQDPVILDTRSPLDFSVSHAPGAINVNWQDFTRHERGHRGILLEDEMALARRLSLWGIDPETPVIIVGMGAKGEGEEGRMAWMLKYLGVQKVQFGEWTLLRSTIPRDENKVPNKPIWKPKPQTQWAANWEELKEEVLSAPRPSSKARNKAIKVPPKALERRNVVLDVTAFERKENLLNKAWAPVKKIFWKDFIDDEGLPNKAVIEELKKNGISDQHIIYVISENGVSSGLVTFVLREFGYQAKNFMGGFEYLYQVKK